MSAYLGKDNSSKNIVHFTSDQRTESEMKNGIIPSTTFHSSNPYGNVKSIVSCPLSANQDSTTFSYDIYTRNGSTKKYDVPVSISLDLDVKSKMILFLIPHASGTGYVNPMLNFRYYSDATAFYYDANEILVVYNTEVYSFTNPPSSIICIVFENNTNNLLSNQLDGSITIDKTGAYIGNINLFDYSFASLTSVPVQGNPDYTYLIKDLFAYGKHGYLAVYNQQTTGDIDVLIDAQTIKHNGKSIIGYFSSSFMKFNSVANFNNSTVTNDSRISNGDGLTYGGVQAKGIIIQLPFTPTIGAVISLQIMMLGHGVGPSTYMPFSINGIVLPNKKFELYFGDLNWEASSADANRMEGIIYGSKLLLYGFIYSKFSPYGIDDYGIYWLSKGYTNEPIANLVSLTGCVANLQTAFNPLYTIGLNAGSTVYNITKTTALTTLKGYATYAPYAWLQTGTHTFESTNGLGTGDGDHNSFSMMEFTAAVGGNIYWQVFGETDYDMMYIWKNGVLSLVAKTSNTDYGGVDTSNGFFYFNAGETITIAYGKDLNTDSTFGSTPDRAIITITPYV